MINSGTGAGVCGCHKTKCVVLLSSKSAAIATYVLLQRSAQNVVVRFGLGSLHGRARMKVRDCGDRFHRACQRRPASEARVVAPSKSAKTAEIQCTKLTKSGLRVFVMQCLVGQEYRPCRMLGVVAISIRGFTK